MAVLRPTGPAASQPGDRRGEQGYGSGDVDRRPVDALQWVSVDYFLKEVNFHNGLIRDKTQEGAPASIAAVGMSLAAAPLAVERGALTREFMALRTLVRL